MKTTQLLGLIIVVGIILPVSALAIFTSYTTVEPGFTGVKITMGKPDLNTAYTPGFYFVAPFGLGQMINVETRENVYRSDTVAASYDLQDITVEVMVNYKPIPNQVPTLYNDLGTDYIARIVDPAVQETMKQITAQYTAPKLIQERPQVKQEVVDSIRDRLSEQPLIITQISVTNLDFTPEYKAAIEAKETAKQLADKSENEIRFNQNEALKAEATAEGAKLVAIQHAEGVKAKAILEAEGKKLAIEMVAEAEANAFRMIALELQNHPELLQLEYFKSWNGILPQTYLGGSGDSPQMLLQVPTTP